MSDEALEILKEIKNTLEQRNVPKMLFVKDVAQIMGINVNKANELWNRTDFPRNTYRTKES